MSAAKPVIGLVGGIGAGKSLVARLLTERGGVLIAADQIAHEALRQPELREKVVERFGREILGPDGEIVRAKVAGLVFADERKLRELEAIVFPWIGMKLKAAVESARAEPAARFVVLDAAVMLEAGWHQACTWLVYVHAPRPVRRARLHDRHWTEEQIAARERMQLSLTEKARRADVAIDNGGSAEQTAKQVEDLLKLWKLR